MFVNMNMKQVHSIMYERNLFAQPPIKSTSMRHGPGQNFQRFRPILLLTYEANYAIKCEVKRRAQMAGNIFDELNQVLSSPAMTEQRSDASATKQAQLRATDAGQPHPLEAKRLGFQLAHFVNQARNVGPLAAPTRSRDHRFRTELSALYDPAKALAPVEPDKAGS